MHQQSQQLSCLFFIFLFFFLYISCLENSLCKTDFCQASIKADTLIDILLNMTHSFVTLLPEKLVRLSEILQNDVTRGKDIQYVKRTATQRASVTATEKHLTALLLHNINFRNYPSS